ncbi:hypothetical protein BUZ57_08250 [Staphylococcus hyicus]|uniref:Uncharacterized protein n=2 Tax=Staphylococcus hyicus TaxID=1284 RepID=A0A418JI18_STAHY|nr:SA1788 family PVL leukocidin-associated protein [Staphylococcus hyicus]NJH82138.1 hypothetical protein [Staphylococcus hyicus]RIO45037.1 hypothetical protein BUZ57_08250 [Staphylococcus hyicus]
MAKKTREQLLIEKRTLNTAQGVFVLNDKNVEDIKFNNMTFKTVAHRLNHNWTLDEATQLQKTFVPDHEHRIVLLLKKDNSDEQIRVPYTRVKEAMDKGINLHSIKRRFGLGWSLEKTLTTPPRLSAEELMYEAIANSEDKFQDLVRQNRISKFKDEKLREEKPHLFNGTPQKHGLTRYGRHLHKNIRIGAYKIDSYGRQQLV